MRYADTIMEAERTGDVVTVTYYGAEYDAGRKGAARVVRSYTRTVTGVVTGRARFTGRSVDGDSFTYRYRITEV